MLLAGDDRASFESGDRALDTWFHRYAGQNQFRHRIGVTYVAVESGVILGFVTVAAGEVQVEAISAASRAGLPAYPIPVLRIGRLAVSGSRQGKGLGESLLRYAFHLAQRASLEFGCAGVVVDAKPKAVQFYERFGFRRYGFVEGSLREAPVTLFLGIKGIPSA